MTLPSPAPTLKKRVAFTSSTGDNEGKTARKYGNKLKRQAENQNMISPTVSPSKLPFAPDPPRSRGLRDQSKIRQTPTSNVAISMQRFSAESAIMAPVLRPQSAVRVKRQQVGTPRPDLIRWVNTSAVQMAPPRVPHQKNSNYVISQPALWSAYPYPAVMPPTPRPVPLPTPELKDLDFVDFCACTYCDGGWESKLESQSRCSQVFCDLIIPNPRSGSCSAAHSCHKAQITECH